MDLIWNPDTLAADWVLDDNGDLSSADYHAAAVILCLFTNKAAAGDQGNLNTWHGNTFDIQDGEDQLGSMLYTLVRAPLTLQTEKLAVFYAQEALRVLVHQGLAERYDVEAESDRLNNRLNLRVTAVGAPNPFSQTFSLLGTPPNDV